MEEQSPPALDAIYRRFGTHPCGPSTVVLPSGEQPLHEFLLVRSGAVVPIRARPLCSPQSHPGDLGVPPESSTSALPYLFKVLSVNTALSIQAHPDKKLAAALHAARSDLCKDSNHKPEMAIALTPFEAMCGFRPLAEIATALSHVPELRELVGEAHAHAIEAGASSHVDSRELLRAAFAAYMEHSDRPEHVADQVTALITRLATDPSTNTLGVSELVKRLNEQYPGDIGVFAPYWFNVVLLRPGEGIFLAANEPHAYLSGDCVECMACSDNVIRAGLTPKHKDVPTLIAMLTYK
jgi:mannose-6-phosphate isomerase